MSKEYLNFEGRNDIHRDPYSKAVINIDVPAYNAAKRRIDNHRRIDNMESEMNGIKNLLTTILEKISEEESK